MPSVAEEALAERARRGDPAAFTALTVRYWSAVHRVARNMSLTRSAADEVTEETLSRALSPQESSTVGAPFRVFLYRLAIDLSLARTPPVSARSVDGASMRIRARDGGPPAEPDWSQFTEVLIQRFDLEEQIRRGLEHVDELDRASFVLREIEQLPAEEAAAVLRISPKRIREGVHRTRLALTLLLRELFRSSAR